MQDLERELRDEDRRGRGDLAGARWCARRTARSATASRSRRSFPRARARALLIFLRFNSPPGALTSIVTNDGRASTLTAIYPDHKGETIRKAVEVAEEFIADEPDGRDLDPARPEPRRARRAVVEPRARQGLRLLHDRPAPARARAHAARCCAARRASEYVPFEVKTVAKDGPPPWLDDFRKAALAKYDEAKRTSKRRATSSAGRRELADWQDDDVDQWFENDELRIRAVAVNTKDLLVDDQKAMGSAPTYQPTQLVDARRAVRHGGRADRHARGGERRGRARPPREHLADPVRDLRAALGDVPLRAVAAGSSSCSSRRRRCSRSPSWPCAASG